MRSRPESIANVHAQKICAYTQRMEVVTGQNGTGQNGTDKMVRTKWYTDKMVWDKMVVIFLIDYNSSEFNSYLVTKSHSEMINIQRKPKRLKVEAGLMKKSYCQWEWN